MRRLCFAALFFICLVLALSGGHLEAAPERIVSLSPSGTEMLFALGQGDHVIAVTEFCDYPPEAMTKPSIGGFAALNLEGLLAMRTDLLVIQDIHEQFVPQLERLNIPYVLLRQDCVDDVFRGLEALGRACGAEERAALEIDRIKSEVDSIRRTAQSALSQPSVLVSVSRELSEPRVTALYAAGRRTFYNELVELAGGVNVSSEEHIAYPRIAQEGLVTLNPDVILDLVGDRRFYHSGDGLDVEAVFREDALLRQWTQGVETNAARSGRIHVLEGTVYLRPGPRLGTMLRAFAERIHPELEWPR